MKERVKAQWVEALRSGEYQQGRNQLRKGDEFCCLGVLCDLAVKAGVGLNVEEGPEDYLYDGETGSLPRAVREWAGLDSNSPVTDAGALIVLNDGEHQDCDPDECEEVAAPWTFQQIADVIEAHL